MRRVCVKIRKNWTKHELQHAQARAFESDREYILPLRLDDVTLPGISHTIGYIDLRSTTLVQVAILLLEKLNLPVSRLDVDLERPNWAGELVDYNGTKVAKFGRRKLRRHNINQ